MRNGLKRQPVDSINRTSNREESLHSKVEVLSIPLTRISPPNRLPVCSPYFLALVVESVPCFPYRRGNQVDVRKHLWCRTAGLGRGDSLIQCLPARLDEERSEASVRHASQLWDICPKMIHPQVKCQFRTDAESNSHTYLMRLLCSLCNVQNGGDSTAFVGGADCLPSGFGYPFTCSFVVARLSFGQDHL